MGRPLTGTIRHNKDGTVTVELPTGRGSKRRPGVRFPNIEQAENWRLAALHALRTGSPVPNPEPFQATKGESIEPMQSGAFADVAQIIKVWRS
jgi:hypothetical protein